MLKGKKYARGKGMPSGDPAPRVMIHVHAKFNVSTSKGLSDVSFLPIQPGCPI